jgi:hypothetical protein
MEFVTCMGSQSIDTITTKCYSVFAIKNVLAEKLQSKELDMLRKLTWPIRKIRLERMVTWYIATCGGPARDKEARRQARELILDGPYNPM